MGALKKMENREGCGLTAGWRMAAAKAQPKIVAKCHVAQMMQMFRVRSGGASCDGTSVVSCPGFISMDPGHVGC